MAVTEAEAEPPAKSDGKARRPAAGGRPTRKVPPPSWRRVGKRGLILAPIMFLLLSFLGKDMTLVQQVIQTLILLAFFLPFSFLMDSIMYRMYLRRGGEPAPGTLARRR